jgi:primosomal protein N' (replication factor Y) (superfamily II helicase)
MHRFARVVVESTLLQLDREFDFLVPADLQGAIEFGQRVKFEIGRSKKAYTGFVVDLPAQSEFATSEITGLVDSQPVLTREVFELARAVADRQCVALGEILKLAIPDHMPRTELLEQVQPTLEFTLPDYPKLDKPLGKRAALLSFARSIEFASAIWPDWASVLINEAAKQLQLGVSAILVVPEQEQVELLASLAKASGISQTILLGGKQRKAERFRAYQQLLTAENALVIGTRSAVYAPVKTLGLLAVVDDLDDSLREQGSPFTHVREIALMRATEANLILTANYRSVEIQRLVEIGYLSDHTVISAPPRISFSEAGLRVDESAFSAIKEKVEQGPVLVLLPRKGSSSAAYCGGCNARLVCKRCGGSIWEPLSGKFECRLCKTGHTSCKDCASSSARPGRTGSSRTVSELGRAFPQVAITEATADKKPAKILPKRQLVVATPGSAPRAPKGYSAVLILDPDVWLYSQSLRAEQLAIRDWQEAIELLAPSGRALIVGVAAELGQAVSLQQHRELASAALKDLQKLGLPPALRIAKLEGSSETIEAALKLVLPLGAQEIATDLSESASTLIKFGYKEGPAIARELRTLALKTNARLVGANKRRGLRVIMDDATAL